MVAGLCGWRFPYDLASLDEERLAFAEWHSHRAGNTEGFGDLALAIGDEWEGEVVFFPEFLLRGRRVAAHANDLEVFGLEAFKRVAKRASLSRAARRVGFRVEINKREASGIGLG